MKSILVIALSLAALSIVNARPTEPTLIGDGVISTMDDEFGLAMSADGTTAYFGKGSPATDVQPMRVICISRLDAAHRWSEPEIAPFSGTYHDMGPALAPDGSRVYFLSDRPNGDPQKHDYNIWYVSRNTSGWSEPHVLAAPVNSPAQEIGVSVTANGTLYFASSHQGGAGSFDIYRAPLDGGEYKTVERLSDAINTDGPELQPAISPDETTLVFMSVGRDDETIGVHKEYVHGDLYVSVRKDGVWTPARNAGPAINSGAGDSWPAFSSDGRRFFFTSERGFATRRLTSRLTWADMKRGLTSTLNGMGNIYEIDASAIRP